MSTLMKKFHRIHLASPELEGYWKPDRVTRPVYAHGNKHVTPSDGTRAPYTHPTVELRYDGSLDGSPSGHIAGEVSPQFPLHTPRLLREFITAFYPDKVTKSCGMHIHFSMSDADYAKLVSREFYDHCLNKAKLWGEDQTRAGNTDVGFERLRTRLSGGAHFCDTSNFNPRGQLQAGRGYPTERYSAINYCYSRFRTVEFRFMPMFDKPDNAVKATSFLVSLVEQWLKTAKAKLNKRHKFTVFFPKDKDSSATVS